MTLKNITTPDFGSATDVTVIEVLIKPGDKIKADDPIVTLESDKATMDLPSSDAGVVKEVKVKVGDKVSTGAVLVTLEVGAAETDKEIKQADKSPIEPKEKDIKPTETKSPEKLETKIKKPEEASEEFEEEEPPEHSQSILTGTVQSNDDVHAGPGVRRLARELGVNLAAIAGSGLKERILKEDVQAYVKGQLAQWQPSGASLPFPPAPVIDFTKFGVIETQALSRIKKISGKNLQRNWLTIPHVTQFGTADITLLEEFRQSQKTEFEKQKIKLTPLAFIMKAVVASLKTFPQFNASLDAGGENLIMKKYYHIGVAVDTPDGLVVPVIRDVDKKGLMDLAKELAIVSEKARKKLLMPNDMQGGSFSISSLGGIGGTAFTPIINAPEVAILGVSKTSYQPVYQEGSFVPRLMLPLSLSYDHRVVDGAEGARFIVHLSNMLSDIRHLLL